MATPRAIEPYLFHTYEFEDSENAAHTEEGARAKGFKKPIVTGAIVYGQMVRPLVAAYGEDYLSRGWIEVRFRAPAYDHDQVQCEYQPVETSGNEFAYKVTAKNKYGELLVELQTRRPHSMPEPNALAKIDPIDWEGERASVSWQLMEVDKPFRRFHWQPLLQYQKDYCTDSGEYVDLYVQGDRPPVHPGIILDQTSDVVSNQFYLDFWIHANSQMTTHKLIRAGDQVELRCIPIDKWRKGDNEWVKFYQVYLLDGEVAIEVIKTSVFKVARRGSF